MSNIEYTTNYRRNLTLYWKQFYPDYTIPAGYHVHHIKPNCTFSDKDDLRIHHPKNLVALHPDDHASMHKCRGDTQLSMPFLTSVTGRIVSAETKAKMSKAQKGKTMSAEARAKMSKAKKGRALSEVTKAKLSAAKKGKKRGPMTAEQKQKLSDVNKGKTFSEETRKKLSLSVTESWDSRHKISKLDK